MAPQSIPETFIKAGYSTEEECQIAFNRQEIFNLIQFHSLPPFHSNVRKELTKMPKLFFLDTGLRNFAIRNFAELSFRPDRGPLFENAIFGEFLKNLGIIDQLFFWRTFSKNEVDLVFTGDINIACEVKLSPDSKLRVPAGLKSFGKIYPHFGRIVATMDQFARNQGITHLPGWMIS